MAGFAAGSLATGIYSIVPAALLLFYLTDVLAVPAASAALVLALPKLWDMALDPLIGALSDRTRSRLGRRRPYLLAGGIALTVALVALFNAPGWADTPREAFRYTLVIYAASATAYAVFSVPYIALPAEINDKDGDRTRLIGARMAVLMVGILAGSALAPRLVEAAGGGREGYAAMSLALAAICGTAMILAFAAAGGLDRGAPVTTPLKLSEWTSPLRRAPLLTLVLTYFLQASGFAAFTAGAQHYAVHALGWKAASVGVLFLVLFACAAPSAIAWGRLAALIGRPSAYALGTLVFAVASASLALPLDEFGIYLAFGFVGVGTAAFQVLSFVMLSDVIDAERGDGLPAGEGAVSGLWLAF
ncbi:MAG: MFS transporter, partial [Blastomonas sp.]|nr:MFS transporter [Blastomonas sp.]